MTVSLSSDKKCEIKNLVGKHLKAHQLTIRDLAKCLGKLVAVFPASFQGPLHYRWLEYDKTVNLRRHSGNFEVKISLSDNARQELLWWHRNIECVSKPIWVKAVDIIIHTDSSSKGWGVVYNAYTVNGLWSTEESLLHTNVLELKAAYFALKSLFDNVIGKHIQIFMDNITAIAAIKKMGSSHNMRVHTIAMDIWDWALCRNNILSAAHIPGVENVDADRASRKFKEHSEWMLNAKLFATSVKHLCLEPEIDLFASRLNKQLSKYVSYCPDPFAMAIDAFNIKWQSNIIYYMFPPFSVIATCLQKAAQEQATAVIVVPDWKTQPWYPMLLRMLVQDPVLIVPHIRNLLMMSKVDQQHPLALKMTLLVCHISGDITKVLGCHRKPRTSFWDPGKRTHTINMLKL